MFKKWNEKIEKRINYYTKPTSVAGLLANWSYNSINKFNKREPGGWLLDIGCGDGSQVQKLKDRSKYIGIDRNLERLEILKLKDRSKYIGIDRNLERLEILKSNYPEVTAIYADVCSLPFKSNSIKYVFSSNTFEHIWYLKDAVIELYRCCTSDAEINIVIPTEGGLWNVGRNLLSKPHFTKMYPDIDFEFISHVEHCNQAKQVIRSLEMFFDCKIKGIPLYFPSIYLNGLLEISCKRRKNISI
ncbi:class I SAM-dependent methyltransferase [Oxynema aestuarii]|uniref:Class I SAM-dependent methyltransferase n=1 Tax=Oxynema aestuarii AP17 TaxID=2064643 RepID=A0A6H1TS51_9CYAN|nr:class I SAM-dependent methyltransferase [Oxynema aestuarii]QIZ69371.1 class I SAM-dependent methyltransferase [Oxynema aestuarii AP17]